MIKTIIFDFGDVFINLDKQGTIKRTKELLGYDIITEKQSKENEAIFKVNDDYEKGLISTTHFIDFYHNLTKNISKEDLVNLWNSLLKDFPKHRLDFIKQLKSEHQFKLILLSNTNELHINWIKKHIPFYEEFKSCFDAFYLSHEIHLRKPNKDIFEFVMPHFRQGIEGIEKESIIEYFWVVEKAPSYSGNRITLQNKNEKHNVEFDLYAPNNLLFAFKSYNGLDSIVYDTIIEEKQHWSLNIDQIDKLEDEDYSAYHANKQYLIYKLDYNSVNGTNNIISYSNSSKNIFNFLNKETSKKNKKAIAKILDDLDISVARDYSAKIRIIEDYIKNNIYVVDSYSEELGDLTTVLNKKIANQYGLLRLFIEMFNQQEIKHEIVITSNRFDLKFDENFESNNFLSEYLFYFPKVDEFISPEDLSSRLGYPDPETSESYGLFIKKINVGDFVSGVGKIKYIKGVEYTKNFDNILVDVTFDKEDLTTTLLDIDRSSGGYYIKWLQPHMHLLKDKDEVLDEQIKFIKKDIEVLSKTVYNDDAKFFGKEPLRVVAKGKSNSFVEKAGNNYLLKVGEFIGQQSEMYQEKERQQPMEAYYRKDYHRVITVTIPEGYTIKNLEEINLNESFNKEEKELMKFESTYTLDGNILTITADEFYDFIRLEKKFFNDYRRVMNAAADFNKVTLILQKN